jgi:hypothetical protein
MMRNTAVENSEPEQVIHRINDIQHVISTLSPTMVLSLGSGLSILAGASVYGAVTYGEEKGWRDYLNKKLDILFGKDSIFKKALVSGGIWGLFHMCMVLMGQNFPQHRRIGTVLMIIDTALLSPLIHYFVEKAQQDQENRYPNSKDQRAIYGSIFHGVFNLSSIMSLLYVKGGNDLTNGMGLSFMITYVIANGILFLHVKSK